jgi:hypothetical protein
MPRTLYSTKDAFKKILAWGQNTVNEWYHPVSRSEFTGLSSVKAGDVIDCVVDGVSTGTKVVRVGEIHEYPLLKHVYGDFGDRADRVIRLTRI